MRKKNQHVIPLGTGWAVKGEKSEKFTVITTTKREAVSVARRIAQNNKSELIIHGKDGKIIATNLRGAALEAKLKEVL